MSKSMSTNPPHGHDNMLAALRRVLAVPKVEIDRREKEWEEQQHKRGRPKKQKPVQKPQSG